MIYINKGEEPDFLIKYKKKNPKATYESDSFKQYIKDLREILVKEQKFVCAYCCAKIDVDKSHVEHIEPRNLKGGAKSKRTLDYSNLVASCNAKNSCGNVKENEYDGMQFISPLNKECEDIFSYQPDGYISGDDYTISTLNLNSYELRNARKAIYKEILYMSNEDIRLSYCSNEDEYFPFCDVIFDFLKRN